MLKCAKSLKDVKHINEINLKEKVPNVPKVKIIKDSNNNDEKELNKKYLIVFKRNCLFDETAVIKINTQKLKNSSDKKNVMRV